MLRKGALALVSVGLILALMIPTAGASSTSFHAALGGYNEVPAVSTMAEGMFVATTTAAGFIAFMLQYDGLEGNVTAAHIHFGQEGVVGGIAAFLCGGGGKRPCPQSGRFVGAVGAEHVIGPAGQGISPGQLDELLAAMEAGVTYVNVHTDTFPGGEIRGRIMTR